METKKINDLGLISALTTMGYTPKDRIKEGNKVFFIFDWNEEMDEIERRFFSNNLPLDAYSFFSNTKSVRHSIFQLLNQ